MTCPRFLCQQMARNPKTELSALYATSFAFWVTPQQATNAYCVLDCTCSVQWKTLRGTVEIICVLKKLELRSPE